MSVKESRVSLTESSLPRKNITRRLNHLSGSRVYIKVKWREERRLISRSHFSRCAACSNIFFITCVWRAISFLYKVSTCYSWWGVLTIYSALGAVPAARNVMVKYRDKCRHAIDNMKVKMVNRLYLLTRGSPIDLHKKQPRAWQLGWLILQIIAPPARNLSAGAAGQIGQKKKRIRNYLGETPRQYEGLPLQRHRYRVLVVAIAGHGRVVRYVDIRLLQISARLLDPIHSPWRSINVPFWDWICTPRTILYLSAVSSWSYRISRSYTTPFQEEDMYNTCPLFYRLTL